MKKPALVILAAGMGSRYGGLKQIDPVDPEGHIIMDFSLYDAKKAGFEEVIFIIKKENEKDFYKIKILTNKGKTLPKGWNVALKEVTGEVVLRVDAHTFFDKDFIWNNVKEIENGENIVGGKCISVTQNNDWKEKLL